MRRDSITRRAACSAGILCIPVLVLSACGTVVGGTQPGGGGGSAGSGSSPAGGALAARPMEVYAVPARRPRNDGTLYLHLAGTAASADQRLGRGTDARLDPAPTAGRHALMHWYTSSTGRTTLGRPGQASAQISTAQGSADAGVPLTSLQVDGTQYLQRGDSVIAVAHGTVTATYALPKLRPDPTAGAMPKGYKGLYSGPQVGTVSALVPAPSGDVLAFTFTGLAAAVTDLMTGHTTAIPGYSRLGPAVRTASGNILILAWKAQDEAKPIQVLSLAAASYRVTAAISTGLPATHNLQETMLPGLGYDAVLAISRGASASSVRIGVWAISGHAIAAVPALPVGSGLAIAPAGTGKVYVYGGPAANKVGLVNLTTGAFTPDIANMRTRAGSYVVGIFS